MFKIVSVIGARPQFVKAAIISHALQNYRGVHKSIIHTGQHFDINMSDVFFEELDIPKPDYHLGIGGGTHGQNTGRMIEAVENVLLKEKPDWLLVFGDTDSTLAAAIAAAKLHIPIAHIEAGLRSFNRQMPEEINRILTDHASSLLFAPTDNAVSHLMAEGICGDKIKQVGDVMYDAALFYSKKAENCSRILQTLELQPKAYILATIHRQENADNQQRLTNIVDGLATSSNPVVLPLHPRTLRRLHEFGIALPAPIYPIEPVGYLNMVMLEKNARLIVTDSGGVQKEAYFHRVPCITLRDETEWTELVAYGFNRLVGNDKCEIAAAIGADMDEIDWTISLYGDGQASHKIACNLLEI